MWVRKTQEEILEDRNAASRRLVRNSLAFWVAFSVFLAFLRGHTGGPRDPALWNLSLHRLIIRIMASFIAGGLGVYLFYWRPRSNPDRAPEAVVCPKCEKVASPGEDERCACGGEMIDSRLMKWVEKRHKGRKD